MAHNLSTERVAAEIRAELARRKVSVRSLAQQLGWSITSTARRVSGAQALTVEDIAAIAAELGVPASQFLADAA